MSTARVHLTFPEALIRQPLVGRLVAEFEVMPNIRRANVEEDLGWMVCELTGEAANLDRAMAWLRSVGVQVDQLGDVVES
ncbi:MAG: NIL domain-containing protein [Acidimicrobiales bacterium]